MSKKEEEKDLTALYIALYIGGPTALFEWGGFRLLTDPTFDEPGCEYKNGPVVLEKTAGPAVSSDSPGPVDVVLLSHYHHFDNLDHAGRQYLPRTKRVITTTEGAARRGGNVIGLLPWESVDIPGNDGQVSRVTGTPAQRGPAHLNRGAVTGFVASLADEPDRAISFLAPRFGSTG
jgi:L-ascorbate metabolism protein UlaG (beta-lactamase superfamily)